jgi:hypothetical protein
MFSPTEQFITQMKFRELRAQRETTLKAYDLLEQRLEGAHNDAERLRLLYDGLRELTFAKQPLHPDVANLEPLMRELDSGSASSETLSFWRAQLEQELAPGRMRAEIVYIFGALLEERSLEVARDVTRDEERLDAQAAMLSRLGAADPNTSHLGFAGGLFDELGLPNGEAQATHTRKVVEEVVYASADSDASAPRGETELETILERIEKDGYRSGRIRAQAQRFRLNPTLLKELSDALTLTIDHLDEWRWPENGVAAHTLWAGNKWRLFLDEDLPTACLLEVLGARWQEAIEKIWAGPQPNRIRRLQRLHEIGAPAIILDHEMAQLAGTLPAEDATQGDIWSDGSEAEARAAISSAPNATPFWGELGSIHAQRAVAQGDLRSFAHFDSYGATEAESGLDQALGLINAEIQLGRAAFPDRPLYVVKLDIKDFYASLRHDLVLSLLARLGLAERDQAFFRRYLAAPIAVDGQRVVTQVGAPVARRLSDILGELTLLLFDRYLRQRARVRRAPSAQALGWRSTMRSAAPSVSAANCPRACLHFHRAGSCSRSTGKAIGGLTKTCSSASSIRCAASSRARSLSSTELTSTTPASSSCTEVSRSGSASAMLIARVSHAPYADSTPPFPGRGPALLSRSARRSAPAS